MKIKKIIIILILSILVLTPLFYLVYKSHQSTNEPLAVELPYPSIQLSKSIKSADAVDAILAYRAAGSKDNLPANQKAIITEIETVKPVVPQSARLTTQPLPTAQLGQTAASQPAEFSDSIILVKDANGNYLEPQIAKKLYQMSKKNQSPFELEKASATYEENFDFDASVPLAQQELYLRAYDALLTKFGPRSYSYITDPATRSQYAKIKVIDVSDDEVRRICGSIFACYFPGINTIYSAPFRPDYVRVMYKHILHELAHAFRGLFTQIPLWEEGSADAIQQIIQENDTEFRVDPDIWGFVFADIANLPYADYQLSPGNINESFDNPYQIGSTAFWKIYLDDPNFFLGFNDKLYHYAVDHDLRALLEVDLIKLANATTSQVEQQPTWQWFTHQFAFTKANSIAGGSIYLEQKIAPITVAGDSNFRVMVKYPDVQSFAITIYDSQDKLLGEIQKEVASSAPFLFNLFDNGVISSENKTYFENYEGSLKFIITTNSDTRNKKFFYTLKFKNRRSQDYLAGVLVGENEITKVKVTSLQSGTSWESTKANNKLINKMFIIDDSRVNEEGKYKIEVTQKLGNTSQTVVRFSNKIKFYTKGAVLIVNMSKPFDCLCDSGCNNSCAAVAVKNEAGNMFPSERSWFSNSVNPINNPWRVYYFDKPSGWGPQDFVQR